MKLTITIDEKDILEHYNEFCEDNGFYNNYFPFHYYKRAFEVHLTNTISANISAGWGFDLDSFVFEVNEKLAEHYVEVK